MLKKHQKKIEGDKVVVVVILSLFCLMILLPFIYIVSVSLSSKLAVVQGKVWLWPVGINLDAYKRVIHYDGFLRSYGNTILYTVLDTAISLVVNTLTAYALSKMHLKGRRAFNIYFMFTMMFSGGLIASYLNMKSLKLVGTIWAVVLPAACGAYNMILMRTFFEQMPIAMEESAIIDGANDFQVFTKIALPLSSPIISTMILFFAVNRWNSWFTEFIYLNDKKMYPLQLVIRSIVLTGETDVAALSGGSEIILGQSIKFAVIILSMIPMLILYPLIQKYLVKGIMLGAIKG